MQQRIFIPEGLTVNHPFFYIIQHTPSGKYYAGYCCKKRYCNSQTFMSEVGYKTSSKVIKELIKNDRLESFSVCKIRHYNSRLDAIRYEAKFLKRVNAMRNPNFLNQTNGDKDFIIKYVTEEHRRKNSEAQKGKTMSEESRRKMSNWQKGRTISRESVEKMRETRKGQTLTEDHKRKIGERHKGKIVSSETRKRLSESNKGKLISDETKRKMSETRRGKIHSEETKQKMRESALIRWSLSRID